MVCKNCGTENADTTRFCVGCGASLAEKRTTVRPRTPAAKEPEIGYCGQPIPPKKGKRTWLIAGAVVAVIVLILVIVLASSGADSCEEVAEKFVVAYLTNDLDTLEQVTEKNLLRYLRTDAKLANAVQMCEADAVRCEKCTEEEMDDLRELYSYLGAKGNFTNAHMVDVEYSATTSDTEATARMAKVALSEIDGIWYVVYIG